MISVKFEKNYPKDRENGWSDELQGVTTDDSNWYFTQIGRLWKFPFSHYIKLYYQRKKSCPLISDR